MNSRPSPPPLIRDGYVLLDKPSGWSSFDCVNFIKRKYNPKKAGHAGALDPIATGLIIIMLNGATRWFDLFHTQVKTYEAKMLLGVSFDTQDITGEITAFDPPPRIYTREEVLAALDCFKGDILQTPPVYSAIKIKGQPAYHYARNGQSLKMEPRPARVEQIELMDYHFPHISFRITCHKGFYVRSICEDIAVKLGTQGVLASLRRTRQSGYGVEQAFKVTSSPQDLNSILLLEKPGA